MVKTAVIVVHLNKVIAVSDLPSELIVDQIAVMKHPARKKYTYPLGIMERVNVPMIILVVTLTIAL